jgi:putative transposase
VRYTSFTFALDVTSAQQELLRRHAGAARFAFNKGLDFVKRALEARKSDKNVKTPWSRFDLINAFNAWKRSPEAGVTDDGKVGLPWRHDVIAQVFEEALVDTARGLQAFGAARRKPGKGSP